MPVRKTPLPLVDRPIALWGMWAVAFVSTLALVAAGVAVRLGGWLAMDETVADRRFLAAGLLVVSGFVTLAWFVLWIVTRRVRGLRLVWLFIQWSVAQGVTIAGAIALGLTLRPLVGYGLAGWSLALLIVGAPWGLSTPAEGGAGKAEAENS